MDIFEGSNWGKKYPATVRVWRDAWERFIPFLEFPPEVRKIIYTTNSIESLNYQLRKIIKNRGHFPNDDAVIKLLWLAIRDIEDKRARERAKEAGLAKGISRKAPPKLVEGAIVQGWNAAYGALSLAFPGRLEVPCDPPPSGLRQRDSSIPANPAGAQPRSTSPPGRTHRPRLDRGEHRHIIHGGGTRPNYKINTVYTEILTTSLGVHRGRHRRLLVHRLGLRRSGAAQPAPDQHQRHHRHPQDQQTAGLPVRIKLLLPDRPVRRRRHHRLLRPIRPRQHRLLGIITLVNTGITLLITPFIPKIIDRFGKKNVFQYCGLFTIIGGVSLFLAPANMFWLVLLTLAIKGIGASLINTVMFGLEADTVEYGEWKTGKRSEGATYALFSFTRKVTQSIGGAVGAWALAIGGYIAASATNPNPIQPDSAIIAIKATIGLLRPRRPHRHAHLHQIPPQRRTLQTNPQRNRSPQTRRPRSAPREPRRLHHPNPRGLTHPHHVKET